MNRSRYLGLLTLGGLALAAIGSAQAYHGDPLPPLYVSSNAALQACPTDKVVWLNWAAPAYHLQGDRWYHNTSAGAFACLGQTTELRIPQGSD